MLGVRLLRGHEAYAFLGTCTKALFPNLSRLYVDTCMLPPCGDDETAEQILARIESGMTQLTPKYEDRFTTMHCGQSNLKAYAIAGTAMKASFGHLEGLVNSREFIKNTFGNLERLYLFTLPWEGGNDEEMQREIENVIGNFVEMTDVELIVNVVVQGREPARLCAPEADVCGYPARRETLTIRNVVVDQPHGTQDILALMHRIIDDFDAEWAPNFFRGYLWHPSTRPRYIAGITTKQTLKKAGIPLPKHCL